MGKYVMLIELRPNTKYGIMLSGGLDSAVLLYIIMDSFVKQNIEPNIQPLSIKKNDQSHTRIPKILDFIFTKFNIRLPDPIFVGDTSVSHERQGASAVNDIRNNLKDITYTFFGSNKIPPVNLDGLAPKRYGNDVPDLIFPFFDLYKTDIIQLTEQYKCTELYQLTHTCTENPITRCNTCWQCRERAWAFKELNITDTGTQ